MEIWMEPVGGAVGPIYDVEWYRIMNAFRQSHAEREKIIRDYPEDQLLDQLLLTLRAEAKEDSPEEVLKCNLLIFLQENVMYFLAEDAQCTEKVCAQLNSILNHLGESNGLIFIKCNVLATLTTILLELELIRTQPRVFESFVEVLFDIISHVNSPADRVLRATACDCLRELALTYPKLLAKSLGHLYIFCQQEVSHAVQAYLSLFSAAFVSCSSAIFEEGAGPLPEVLPSSEPDSPRRGSLPTSSSSSSLASLSSSSSSWAVSSRERSVGGAVGLDGSTSRTTSSTHISPGTSLLAVVAPLCPFQIPDDVQLRPPAYPSQHHPHQQQQKHQETTLSTSSGNVLTSSSVTSVSLSSLTSASSSTSNDTGMTTTTTVTTATLPLLHIPDAFLRDVRRSVLLLVESAPRLTEWGLATVLDQLISFVGRTDLPRDVFKHYFLHYANTNSLILVHAVITVMLRFPEVMQVADYRRLIDQLFWLIDEPLLSTEKRILVIEWLRSLERYFPDALVYHLLLPESPPPSPSAPRQRSSSSSSSSSSTTALPQAGTPSFLSEVITAAMRQTLPPLLFQYYNRFYPVIFDSWALREAKLLALCSCFNADSAVPPPTILRVLACVEEYRFYDSTDRRTVIAFRVLSAMLLAFTELYAEIYKYFLNLIQHMPKFLPNVIKLITDIKNSPVAATSRVAAVLLSSLNEVFIAHPIGRLAPYLSLLEPIVSEPSIDPTNLLRRVLQFLKQTSYCQQGKWHEGDAVLAISRAALLTHPTRLVFKPLGELLLFCVHNYADVDIRDRAHFYYQLLTHVSTERLRAILTPASDQAEDEEKTIGMQTTHLPKIPVLNYPLHTQLLLARRTTAPATAASAAAGSSPRDASGEEVEVVGPGGAFEAARGTKNESDRKKREESEEEKCRRTEETREAEERLVRDYYARLLAGDSANDEGCNANGHNDDNKDEADGPQRPGFTLHFTLRYKSEAEQLRDVVSTEAAAAGKNLPPRLYTLVLRFAQSRVYEPLESVHVPYLCRADEVTSSAWYPPPAARRNGRRAVAPASAPESDGATARVPYEYDVGITFRPLAPLPTSFAVSAMFNDREGHICEGQMEPVHVHFTDLFLPLPLAGLALPEAALGRASSSVDDSGIGGRQDDRLLLRVMWRQLWRRVLLPDMGLAVGASDDDGDARGGDGRSVKFMAKGREAMTAAIARHFGQFVVPAADGEDQDDEEEEEDDVDNNNMRKTQDEEGEADAPTTLRVMIFLPPRYHLLVKAQMRRDTTVLHVRTDFWRVLPYVDPLFDSLCLGL